MSEKKSYKHCIVPKCKSSTFRTPDKLFISVPTDPVMRKKWCHVMGRDDKKLSPKTSRHCCGDHFNLEEDIENFMRFKMMGGRILLKKNVVPHIFTCQNDASISKHEAEECPSTSDFDKACRVCLSRTSLHSIFKYKDPLLKFPQDLSTRLRKCLGIRIRKGDGLPDKICEKCFGALKMASNFRALGENSDKRLREALKYFKLINNNHATKNETIQMETPVEVKIEFHPDYQPEFCVVKEEMFDQKSNILNAEIYSDTNTFAQSNMSNENNFNRKEDDCEDAFDMTNLEFDNESETEKHDTVSEKILQDTSKNQQNVKSTSREPLKNTDLGFDDLSFYGCLLCEERFPSRKRLATHMADRHGEVRRVEHRCYGCDREFHTRRAMLLHEKNDCLKMPPGSTYQCRKCPAVLRSRTFLERHAKQHESGSRDTLELGGLFPCPVCRKTFGSKTYVRGHVMRVHMPAAEVTCRVCNKTVKSKFALRAHMLHSHSDREYACAQCPYRTNEANSLMLHVRTHSGERPYACEWCAHRSVSASNLQKHRLIHTGVRKYECSECGNKYKAKVTLVDHMNFVHRGLRLHCCDRCGKAYSRRDHLRVHLRKAHHPPAVKTGDDTTDK